MREKMVFTDYKGEAVAHYGWCPMGKGGLCGETCAWFGDKNKHHHCDIINAILEIKTLNKGAVRWPKS